MCLRLLQIKNRHAEFISASYCLHSFSVFPIGNTPFVRFTYSPQLEYIVRAGFARYLTGVKYFILRFGLQIFGENRKRIDSNELWVSLQRKRTKCFRKKTSSECVITCVTALIVVIVA